MRAGAGGAVRSNSFYPGVVALDHVVLKHAVMFSHEKPPAGPFVASSHVSIGYNHGSKPTHPDLKNGP